MGQVYDEFVKRSVEKARKRKTGDTLDPTVEHGAQVSLFLSLSV